MKSASLAAVLLLTAAPLAHAITLAPGQTGVPDLLPREPNANAVDTGAGAALFGYPGFNPAGFHSTGVFQDPATLKMSYAFDIGVFPPDLPLHTITISGYKGYSVDAGYNI